MPINAEIQSARNVVVLTGAGISAESGIQTFRASDGLWEDHRIEDVATPEGFTKNPTLVHSFYNQRRAQLLDNVRPNAAHIALAEFERLHTGIFTLITQNVDNLHETAGSTDVWHMHGELQKVRCMLQGSVLKWTGETSVSTECPCCAQAGTLRPHIVWFGEEPMMMEAICNRLAQCDLFVSIGTSGNVYPAAGFMDLAAHAGARTVEVNLEPSSNAHAFDCAVYGPATEAVPRFFSQL